MRVRRRTVCSRWAAALGTAALVVVGGCGSAPQAGPLPAVELQPLVGGEAIVADEIDGPAVVNLWATWCAPCRAELPAFQAASDQLEGRVRFIGVNQGDDGAPAAAFLDEEAVTFEQYLDPDGELSEDLGVTGLPATLFIAADGRTELHSGALDEGELLDLVAEHLTVTP